MLTLRAIKMKNGEVTEEAHIDEEAFPLPGFIAVKRYDGVIYIAASEISSIVISDEERDNIYNFIPPAENRQKG